MSEFDTWEDKDFTDTIVAVSSLDDDAELLRALREFAERATNIEDVVDEERMSIRFQVREPSGKRMRDPEFFPRVINIDGAAPLVEKILIALCHHEDPYEFYYDEEAPALLYGIKELLDKDVAYFYLMPRYLKKIEAQAPPIGMDCLEPLSEKWKEESREKYFMYLAVICAGTGPGNEEFPSFSDEIEDDESEFNVWLHKEGSIEKVVSQFATIDKVFMTDTRRELNDEFVDCSEKVAKFLALVNAAYPEQSNAFTQWNYLRRNEVAYVPSMFGNIDLSAVEEKHFNLLLLSYWVDNLNIDAETLTIQGYEGDLWKELLPEKVDINQYPWAFVHDVDKGVYYMNQFSLFAGADKIFFEVLFSDRFTPEQVVALRQLVWDLGGGSNLIMNMFDMWPNPYDLLFFAAPVKTETGKKGENPIENWLFCIENALDQFPEERLAEVFKAVQIGLSYAVSYYGSIQQEIRKKIAEKHVELTEEVPFPTGYTYVP